MELNHNILNGVTILSQSQYTKEILEHHGMADSQSVKILWTLIQLFHYLLHLKSMSPSTNNVLAHSCMQWSGLAQILPMLLGWSQDMLLLLDKLI